MNNVSDKKSNFEELLERYGSVSLHHQNIRFIAIEIFKVGLSSSKKIVLFASMRAL